MVALRSIPGFLMFIALNITLPFYDFFYFQAGPITKFMHLLNSDYMDFTAKCNFTKHMMSL